MLSLQRITKRLGGRVVLRDVSLEVAAGEYVAVVGESGIGKSTLLNAIAGLEPVDAGQIVFEERKLGAMDDDALTVLRREKFGFVFQAFHILPNLTVHQNVALPLLLRKIEDKGRAQDLLAAVGLLFTVLGATRIRFTGLVLAAVAIKTMAFAVLMRADSALAWLTPGAQIGLAAGLAVAFLGSVMPRIARLALAALLIMAATVLLNLSPPNPYLAASLKVWQQGHFLNFNGLTRLVGAVWPFDALVYIIFFASLRR